MLDLNEVTVSVDDLALPAVQCLRELKHLPLIVLHEFINLSSQLMFPQLISNLPLFLADHSTCLRAADDLSRSADSLSDLARFRLLDFLLNFLALSGNDLLLSLARIHAVHEPHVRVALVVKG